MGKRKILQSEMQKKQNNTALIWFTNNLRVQDNVLLENATKLHKKVIGVYFFNPEHFENTKFGFKKTEKYRAQFLIESVANLQQNLAKQNITLLTYTNTPEEKIETLCKQYSVDAIYYQKEWTSEEVTTINSVKKATPANVSFVDEYDQFLYQPEMVSKNFSNIPEVFTAFRKKLEKYVSVSHLAICNYMPMENKIHTNTKIPTLTDLGFTEFTPHLKTAFPFKGGETEANKRIENYFFESKKVAYYKKTRNGLLGVDYSTKLSAWLANGSISAKTIYYKVKEFEEKHGANDSTYWVIFELIWRDYFKYISLKHQNNIFKIGGILHRKYDWISNTSEIKNWINGTTKDNFVNANMIELKETGWMSNRGRQNVASYFAKEMLLDWRIGAAYFESLLLDYDVHSNYGNWLYVAGVGNDPRDRKFNTQLQAARYDGDFKFRNLWLQKTLF